MLVTKNRIDFLHRQENWWKNSHYSIYWKGFIFLPGTYSELASIEELARQVTRSGIQAAVSNLHGNCFILIQDKITNNSYAFVDNSGIFHAFYSAKGISTSFLDLIEFESLSKSQLSREAVVEFINFGNIFFNRTFFDSIRKIGGNQILTFHANGKVTSFNKSLPDIEDTTTGTSFLEFFEQLSSSIKDQKVSVDLTGGIDSRLVAVLFDYFGLDFEVSVVGASGDRDKEISSEVAEKLKHPFDVFNVTSQSAASVGEQLDELFTVCDGCGDLFRNYFPFQHQKARANRGVTLAVSGNGGELYKDFWWLQDFPFYNRKQSNIEKLYDLRIHSIPFNHSHFISEYSHVSRNLKARTLKQLAEFTMDINTKTYDNIYFKYKMQEVAGQGVTRSNNFSRCKKYVPLLELDLVRYGFNLPRKERFFNNFHRKTITNINRNVAGIQTTEGGMSVSSQKIKMVQDIFRYVNNRGIRLTKKIAPKLLKKPYVRQAGSRDCLYSQVRKLSSTKDAIELLKDEGIINGGLKTIAIEDEHLGRLVSLGLLLKHMESNGGGQRNKPKDTVYTRRSANQGPHG